MPKQFHVPDYLILPFGHAVKADITKIALTAVSADGLYFSTDVPVIYIRKRQRQPIWLMDFERSFGKLPKNLRDKDEQILNCICAKLKQHNPDMTRYEEMFLDLYFEIIKLLMLDHGDVFVAIDVVVVVVVRVPCKERVLPVLEQLLNHLEALRRFLPSRLMQEHECPTNGGAKLPLCRFPHFFDACQWQQARSLAMIQRYGYRWGQMRAKSDDDRVWQDA